jgi:flagellar export protein FliJ
MPSRFVLGLQPLIDRRRHVEESTRRIVDARQLQLGEAKRKLDRLTAQLRARVSSLQDAQALERAIGAQVHLLAQRQAALDEARKELVNASKNRAIAEKLKERHRLRAEAERARREEAEIDESNARR